MSFASDLCVLLPLLNIGEQLLGSISQLQRCLNKDLDVTLGCGEVETVAVSEVRMPLRITRKQCRVSISTAHS